MRTEIQGDYIILKAYEKSFVPRLFEAEIESGATCEGVLRQVFSIGGSRHDSDFFEQK
jgi:hypothetical protein